MKHLPGSDCLAAGRSLWQPAKVIGLCALALALTTPVMAQDAGGNSLQQADCGFLAENFRGLETAIAQVDIASARAGVLAELQANVASLHRRRGCPAQDLVAALGSAETPSTDPDPAATRPQTARKSPGPSPPVSREATGTGRPSLDDLITTDRLPVRVRPDPDADVLGVLEQGSLVPVISRQAENGWLTMDLGEGRVGYVPESAVITRGTALRRLRERVVEEAHKGDPEAQFQAGNIAVATDMGAAIDWWRKAADQGHPGAQYNLGVAYVDGSIQPPDSGRAVGLWRTAAEQGHEKAQQALAKAEKLITRSRSAEPTRDPSPSEPETSSADDSTQTGERGTGGMSAAPVEPAETEASVSDVPEPATPPPPLGALPNE